MDAHDAALRQAKILESLRKHKQVRVADLAGQLGVSKVTVRADLDALAGRGVVQRTHGGAVTRKPVRREDPLEIASRENAEAKRRIGRHAAALLSDGETVIIDVGSTTTELVRALSPELRDVVVITNSLNIALLLESHPGVTVIVTGGTLRALQHSLVNPYATRILQEINADKAFIGCNGVHLERGFTNSNLHEAEIKFAMAEVAREVVFLADHSKLLFASTARIAPLSAADRLITDAGVTADVLERLRDSGLKVDVA